MRTQTVRIAWGVLAALLLVGATARADQAAAYKKYRGQIVVSDSNIPADFDVGTLKKLAKTTLGGGSPWSLHFVGFMKTKPSASPINLVFYDVTKKRTFITAKEIVIDPHTNILISDMDVSEDDGLTVGHTYEVLLARMAGGHETVYAKVKLTLK